MRQVFSSLRVENAEAVAQMLRDAGIEVKVTDGQSYHGSRRRTFSYRDQRGDDSGPRPTVWVIRAEEQVRARELLREAGLLESSRPGVGSYLPPSSAAAPARKGPGMHWRILLLLAIAVGMALVWYAKRHLDAAPPAVVATPAPARPAPAVEVVNEAVQREPHALPVPSALAALLVREAAFDGPAPCVLVDGEAPSDAVRAALDAGQIADAAACGQRADIRIGPWRTDGSGQGSVAVQVLDGEPVIHQAQREGSAWHVQPSR